MSSVTPETATRWWPTEEEKQILRDSLFRLIPRSDEAAEAFYQRLFLEHPSVRPLFPQSMDEQQQKMVLTLASMVDYLDDPETFRRECIELGRRHVGYGAQPAHYPVVGQILLEEFGKWQVPPMTEREISLWQLLYGLVSEQMIAAA